jgi:hypothetical protein
MTKTRARNDCSRSNLNITRFSVKIDSIPRAYGLTFSASVTEFLIQSKHTGKAPMARAVYSFMGKHAGMRCHVYIDGADSFTLAARITKRPDNMLAFLRYGNGKISSLALHALDATISHKGYQRMPKNLYHRAVCLLTDGHPADRAARSRECPVQEGEQPAACRG